MNGVFYVIEILANIIDIGIIYYLIRIFFKKVSDNVKYSHIILSIFLLSLLCKLSNEILGNAGFHSFLISITTIFLIAKKYYKITLKKYLLIMCFYFIVVAIIDMTVVLLTTTFLRLPANALSDHSIYRMLAVIISKLLLIIVIFITSFFTKLQSRKIIPYIPLLISMLTFNSLIIYFSFNMYVNSTYQSEVVYIMAISIISIIISIISIFIVHKIIIYCNNEVRLKAAEDQYKNLLKYYSEYEEMSNEISSERHDFYNHMISINDYAKNNQIDKVINYTNNLLYNTNKTKTLIKVKYRPISALINYKMSLIDKYNIEFKSFINVPNKIHVNDVDISIILGNALDNAIEACQNSNEKFIDLYINYDKKCLKIKISNSKLNKLIYKENKIQTTKEDPINHGFGLKNIKRAVDRYNGYFNIIEEDSLFILEIFI